MQFSRKKPKFMLRVLFLTGLCLVATACWAGKPRTATTVPAASAVPQNPPCTRQDCPDLVITQSGKISKYLLSGQGIQSAAPMAQPGKQTQNGRWIIDTGVPSPNSQWIAFTTIGKETGGPVLLQDLTTGQWTNLIDGLNTRLLEGQPAFPMDAWWDVIGWFPDSASLMIGPTDLSQAVIVNLSNFAARSIPFPGGGKGGRLFVGLAPDGSRFSYIGENDFGEQLFNVVDLHSGQTSNLLKQAYPEGILYNPRFSPDHQQIAYLLQKGSPDSGLTYSLRLLSPGEAQPRVLVEGNLGLTIPVWSPDGQSIAFTRNDSNAPQRILPGASPQPQTSNIWVVSLADGKTTQVTFLKDQVRSPLWAKDSQLLAFVTENGSVQMVNKNQSGRTWQIAGPSPDPALTSVFFLP